MNASVEPRVEIDEQIKRDEQLLTAVEAASDVFRRAVDSQPDLVPRNGMLSWMSRMYSHEDKRVVRKYSEPNPDGKTQRSITTEMLPSALLDPVQRDVSMLRLLSAISRWRLDEVNERIREHLRELDSEEQHAVANAH